MFRKYEKTNRLIIPEIDVAGKFCLSSKDAGRLLNGRVYATEKMDGANVGIIRCKEGFRLQKRGSLVDFSEHEQFNFFKAWSEINREKLLQIPMDHILYGELMFAKHTIGYNKLPDFFLAFALRKKGKEEYEDYEVVSELCDNIGIRMTPFIAMLHSPSKERIFPLIPGISRYGNEPSEGIVLWNYKKNLRAKVVREEFIKDMAESDHWSKGPIRRNFLAEWARKK